MTVKMKVNFNCRTEGTGLWSNQRADVHIIKLILHTWDYEGKNDVGHLNVVFDLKSWNTVTDGLIYTDPFFEIELKQHLKKLGLPGDIGYSEQGMQGENYVDFDVGASFIKKFFTINGRKSSLCKPPKPKTKKEIATMQRKSMEIERNAKLQYIKDALDDYFKFIQKNPS